MAQPQDYPQRSHNAAPPMYSAPPPPMSSAYRQGNQYPQQPQYGYPQQPQYGYPQQPQHGYPQQPQYGYTEAAPAHHQPVAVVVAPNDPSLSSAPPKASYAENMEKRVRLGFMRKVYGILTVQLFVTFGIVCVFAFVESVKEAVQSKPSIMYAAIAVSFASLIALSCCPGVAKNVPGNYICLAVFTLSEAYLLGAISSYYSTSALVWSIGALVIIVVGLTLFAFQTKIDFTTLSGSLFVILLAFILFGIWAAIFRSQVVQTIYATLGVIIFGIFLVYDTQLVIGGKHHAVSYTSDDYVFAALNLYLDIVQMFLYLLRLFGNRD
jgi:FtsH-binding integral membrane protein